MNLNKLIGSLALTALVSAGLSSCSNDMEDYRVSSSLKTVINKAPKIKAYSGEHTWGNANDLAGLAGLTRADGTNGTISWEEITTTALDLEAEAAYIDKKLPEGEQTIEGVDYDFIYHTDKAIEVEMFPVYMQTNKTQSYGLFYYDADGTYHEQLIWENFTQWNRKSQQWSQDLNKNLDVLTGYRINIPANTTFGFFIAICDYKPTDWSSEWNVQDKAYTSSHLNKEGYNSDASYKTRVRAITWYENGKTYLGFEDWTDFDYQDLVFTMDKEVSTVDASTFTPGETGKPGETCDKCGHDSHLPGVCPDCDDPEDGCYIAPDDNCELCDHPSHNPGHCDECDKFQGCNKPGSITPPGGNFDPGFNVTPNNPPVVDGDDHTNEVEVNLGVDTKGETSNGKYNESHLSIHVRSAVDVDMFIPMPLNMICPADDMEIVKKHLAGLSDHGGEFTNAQYDEDGKVIMEGGLLSKMTYEIKDAATGRTWTVSINVEYVAGNGNTAHNNCPREINEAGIHIWTEGLEGETELFQYLQETYGDGITFEIWNYYNDESTLDELKEKLDKATIDFIGNVLPDFFINAFGEENFKEGKDCNVNLVDDKQGDYSYKGEGPHLNASSHNKIYKKTVQDKPYPPVY